MAAESNAKFDPLDIHVAQGDTAAYALRCCLGIAPDRTLIGTGDLSFGPLPKGPGVDTARLAGSGAIHLWLGDLLSERLLAFRLVALLQDMGVDHRRIRLVDLDRIDFHDGHAPTIATLDCDQFDLIGPWRTPSAGMAAVYAAAWEAVSDPSPRALVGFCTREAEDADDPVHALRAFLTRYPATDTGLPFWDQVLLESCRAHGPMAANVIGHAMARATPYPDWPGDATLYRRLKRMADPALPHPLVKLAGDPASMRTAEAALSRAGARVLDGADSAIALNGIDDWIGGVHLGPHSETLWLHEGDTLVPADPQGHARAGRKDDRRRPDDRRSTGAQGR